MLSVFENWLVELGVESGLAAFGATATGAVAVLLLAFIADLVAKRVLLRAVVILTERTESTWDDVVAERRVFHRLAHMAPALVIYLLAPAEWGRGHASEVGRALLAHAFETLGLERVIAQADTPNTKSIDVMERLGMQFDRTLERDGVSLVQYAIERDGFGGQG